MIRVTHTMLRTLLTSAGLSAALPEFGQAVAQYRGGALAKGRCHACQKTGQEFAAMNTAKRVLAGLDPARREEAKRRMGVAGKPITLYLREGLGTPKTVVI